MAELIHATAIAFGAHGVLLRGPSGAGKSDLALRCIWGGHTGAGTQLRAASLVADDQVIVEAVDGAVVLRTPAQIAGLIEVRGVGVVRLPHVTAVGLALVVDLVTPGAIERLPQGRAEAAIAGIFVPLTRIAAFEISAPIKVALALDRTIGGPSRVET